MLYVNYISKQEEGKNERKREAEMGEDSKQELDKRGKKRLSESVVSGPQPLICDMEKREKRERMFSKNIIEGLLLVKENKCSL